MTTVHSPVNKTSDYNCNRNLKRFREDDDSSSGDLEQIALIKNIDESTPVSTDVLYQVLMNNSKMLDDMKKMINYLIDENAKFRSDLDTMKEAHDDAIKELHELKNGQSLSAPTNVEILSEVKDVQRSIQSLNCGSVTESVMTKPTSGNYATVVKSSAATYASITKAKSKVVIKPKNPNSNSTVTKSAISEVVDPSKFPIINVRETKNGGLVVECKDDLETDNLKKDVEQKLGANYEVITPSGRTPKVKIIGLSDELTADKIMEQLLLQNGTIFRDGSYKVVQTFKTKKSYGAKLEVDGTVFKRLIDAGRVLIGWDSCVVHEAFDVLRCYNCLGFHHTAKNCKSAKACIKCGLEHESSNCQAKSESCVNCVKAAKAFNLNIDIGHGALSKLCTVYQKKLSEERSLIDYEFVLKQ